MKDVLKLVIEIVRGMQFVHSKGLIHRDLKLANIMLTLTDQAKIGDFGTALFKTRTKGNIGTLGYQAPEVFLPPEDTEVNEYTSKIDVYSFGICLWHMLTRSRANPLLGKGLNEIKMKTMIKRGKFLPWPEKLQAGPESCMKTLKSVMDQCVAFNPDDRPDFTTIRKNLEELWSNVEYLQYLSKINA
eukprot:jgi/Bigna1/61118/fgenesh1_kg.18_\